VLKRLAKDSIIYGGADFCSKSVALFTFPLVASVLSREVYGFLELCLTTAALLGMIIHCGVNNAVQRFYWDGGTTAEERPTLVSSSFCIQFLIGCFVLLCGFVASPYLVQLFDGQGVASLLSWVAIFSIFIITTLNIWHGYMLDVTRLHLKPWRFLTISLSTKVTAALLSCYVMVYLDYGLSAFLLTQAAVLLFFFPISCFLVKKDLTLSLSSKWFTSSFKFGYPFIYAGLAFWLFGSMDRWMLTSYASLDEVGIYSVAFKFSSIILFISTAFGMAWSPISIKIKTDYPQGYKRIYADLLLVLLFFMLFCASILSLFSGEIVQALISDEYSKSSYPLIFLCFGVAIHTTGQITAVGISIEKKTHLFGRVAWFSVFLNFVLNWVLIPKYGSTGAALSTLVCHFYVTVSYLYFTQKLHFISFQYARLLMFSVLAVLIIVISFALHSSDFIFDQVLFKLLSILVFFVASYFIIPKGNIKNLLKVSVDS
jgi:O-antigen/teichoic acid export membrane protein